MDHNVQPAGGRGSVMCFRDSRRSKSRKGEYQSITLCFFVAMIDLKVMFRKVIIDKVTMCINAVVTFVFVTTVMNCNY